jgi:hypothetical protein
MFALRRAAVAAPRLARGYAEAVSDKLNLTLVLPHDVSNTHPGLGFRGCVTI